MNNDNFILCPEQARCIWTISFLSIFSSLYAIYRGYYDLALVPGGIFLTSINYWRHPTYSWRRNVDIIYVKLALIYQLIRSYGAEYCILYYVLVFISLSFYYCGVYYGNQNKFWHSTYSHCLLHIMANISNFVLYSGYIVPIESNPIIKTLLNYFTDTNTIITYSSLEL
jgi:hypothetical protein